MALERQMNIEVSDFGKLKTVVLLGAMFVLLINKPMFDLPLREVGMIGIWIGLLLSLYSAWAYGQSFLKMIKN